ncbi:TrkA family potassium uptake protein [Schaalia sp. 19OD2882]|uniref:potassium channel family protein n=1 Tax=Schaalia sp. 19OD2882 TaxID=2794089 RepID=UPI001C1EF6D0|nr:TrkA family potassium uptake protein [Schaalia sp. 19OD2882]QWW20648.1 TrkA family potassium uptake protein [Schaalia sp. 19OD2882]
MGCGRVGALLATTLDQNGHSVGVIDADPRAFARLPQDFSGRRVTGLGMDREVLRQAGLKDAYAFAAVSSGDNSNIISARLAREVFHVERAVARINDPARAIVYERLGIPTVATVQRTAQSVLRRLLPPSADVTWTHPSGMVSLVTATPVAPWLGVPFPMVEELTGERIAFVSRLGAVVPARADLVVQEHDQLFFAVAGKDATKVKGVLTRAPKLEA